jgi:hypothetical protein
MPEVTDILFDANGDVLCKHGDLVCEDATYQHQEDLLWEKEGERKQFPATGVGLENFLLDEDPGLMLRKIRMQFVADGMKITELNFLNNLKIRASYQ